MSIIGVALAVLLGLSLGLIYKKNSKETPSVLLEQWELAVSEEKSQVNQILMRLGKPLLSLPLIYESGAKSSYRTLQTKVLSSGAFKGRVELFLAAQGGAAIFGICTLLSVLIFNISGGLAFSLVGMSVGVIGLPWNNVSKSSNKRVGDITDGLPQFAELLLMPLQTGMTVVRSVAFTANRLEGVVAEEMRNLVNLINTNSMPEYQAFQLIATRLGTPEASSFLATLAQGHIEGAKVTKTIESQAESLRQLAYQRERGKLKKLPVKLVMIIALHVIPLLLTVMLLPALVALGSI
jgi:pilus assembly protein TadC